MNVAPTSYMKMMRKIYRNSLDSIGIPCDNITRSICINEGGYMESRVVQGGGPNSTSIKFEPGELQKIKECARRDRRSVHMWIKLILEAKVREILGAPRGEDEAAGSAGA